jgi:hypothetical protein
MWYIQVILCSFDCLAVREDYLFQNFHNWSWNDLPEQGLEVAVGEDWNVVLHCIGWKELSEGAVR